MKRFVAYSCMVVMMLVALACGNNEYVQEAGFCTATPTGDSVQIPFGQTIALFTGCKDNIPASISNINDSRCPEGVQCVWAGKLNVVLKLGSMELSLEKDKVVDTSYDGKVYSFNLLDAMPRPAQSQVKPNQTVFINITRGGRRAVGPDNMVPLSIDSNKINRPVSGSRPAPAG